MKKWIGIIVVLGLLLFGVSATTIGASRGITRQDVGDNISDEEKKKIAENVLKDTGLNDRFNTSDIRDISIYYGEVDGEGDEDIVISVEFGPTETVVAAYRSVGDDYEYLGTVGTFFTVESIDLIPIARLGKDIVVVNERANQRIGAFEDSRLIRGYLWKGTEFDNVLQLASSIETEWNRLWDSDDPNGPSQWERISMTSDISYENETEPIINTIQYQRHETSRDIESRMIPADDTYFTVKERVVTQNYYWSDEWERFLLFEMIEKATGQKVAVIEDLDASPYALLPEYSQYANQYQIVRKDGTKDFVQKDMLEPIDDRASRAVYKSLP